MTSTLTISDLTKRFGEVAALTGVSLTVAPGERVALLGHNGAGKSTLMKVILGLIPATSGAVTICDAAPGSAAARRAVAYLPENAAFHPALTGLEQIRHYLALRGESPALAMGLLEKVGLAQAARRRIGTYSKGMRQRVGLAQALIGHPRLLVLDEPTSGLDPVSRREFYALLDDLAAKGASILLSKGQMVAEGSLPDLRRRANLPVALHVTARNGYAPEIGRALPNAILVDGALHMTCPQSAKLETLGRIAGLGDKVADLDVLPPSLEDLYAHFSQGAAQ